MAISQGAYFRNPSSKTTTLIWVAPGQAYPDAWINMGSSPGTSTTIALASGGKPPAPSTPAAPIVSNSTSSVVPTPTATPNISDGGVYQNPSGTYITTPDNGMPLPSSWVKVDATTIPDSANVVSGVTAASYVGIPRISDGGTYQAPNGQIVSVPSGQGIPQLWVSTSEANIDTTGANIIQAPDAAAVAQSAYVIQVLTGIATAAGVAGLAYVGYLVITDQDAALRILKRLGMIKDVLYDTAQITLCVAALATIGFASYEFWSAYERNGGDIGATLGDLISSVFVTVLTAIADGLIDLVEKIWDVIKPW